MPDWVRLRRAALGLVHQLSQNAKALGIAPDLAGLVCVSDDTKKAVAPPLLVLANAGCCNLPSASADLGSAKSAVVDVNRQYEIRVVANKGIDVMQLTGGTASKAVAVLNV